MYTLDVEGEVVVSKPTAGMYGSSSPVEWSIYNASYSSSYNPGYRFTGILAEPKNQDQTL